LELGIRAHWSSRAQYARTFIFELELGLQEKKLQTPNSDINKKAVLPQGNRVMPQVFFSVEVCQQHSLQV